MLKIFYEILDNLLKKYTNKNIILYGVNESVVFVREFILNRYHKKIKFVMDRWKNEECSQIIHLLGLYYAVDENDVIINLYPLENTPLSEFEDMGEDKEKLKKDFLIVELYDLIYGNTGKKIFPITFYGWLEYKKSIDITNTIRRKDVRGIGSHGYYATNFIMLNEMFSKKNYVDKKSNVFDFGCGKGANIFKYPNS